MSRTVKEAWDAALALTVSQARDVSLQDAQAGAARLRAELAKATHVMARDTIKINRLRDELALTATKLGEVEAENERLREEISELGIEGNKMGETTVGYHLTKWAKRLRAATKEPS